MSYTIEFSSTRVIKQLSCLPNKIRIKIQESISALRGNPRPMGIVQIDKDIYRLKIGRYRIVYKIYDSASKVVVLKAAKRSESTYKEFN